MVTLWSTVCVIQWYTKLYYRAGGTGPADPATAGPIFSAYLIAIQIEEVASVYKDDIDVSEFSTQLVIFGTSFSEPKATIHEVIKCLQSLSASQRLLLVLYIMYLYYRTYNMQLTIQKRTNTFHAS